MKKIIASMIVAGLLLINLVAFVDVTRSASKAPFANIYVDDDNTQGPWDGTLEHPYRTIIDGVDNASEGDTVFVFNGIYSNEYIYVKKSIKLVGENKYNAIIDGPYSAVEVEDTINNQILDGFEIRNFMLRDPYAIYLYDCSHSIVNENILIGDSRGVILTNCSNCTVSNNVIEAPWDTITLRVDCVNNKINGNYLYGFNESGSGIDISSGSNDNIISNNIISNCEEGLSVLLSQRAIITDNNFINSTNFGVTLIDSPNSTISGNKITNGSHGIDMDSSDDVTISDNTIKDNTYGINLGCSKNIEVSHNILDNNPCGIFFGLIKNSICSNNTVSNSSETGIDIMDSGSIDSNNIISYNSVRDCYNGIMSEQSWGNNYKNNNVSFNEFGIIIYGAANFNVITKNEIRKNGCGVVIYGFKQGKTYAPTDNWVVGNNICENTNCGVYATELTRLNHIYYNNLVGNDLNAFDNGTNIWYKFKLLGKSMGNYWDNYTGQDSNNDGIGDSPYDVPPLPFRNKDNYPSMEPIDVDNIEISCAKLIQSSPQSQPQSEPGSQRRSMQGSTTTQYKTGSTTNK